VSTSAEGINNAGDIAVNVAFTATGKTAGYERFANGTFSAALNDPDSAENTTGPFGINDSGEIDGTYQQSTTSYDYGFFLSDDAYNTYYQGATCSYGPCETFIAGINNKEDFVGQWFPPDYFGNALAFVATNSGDFSQLSPSSSANGSDANAINNKSTEVVGLWEDSSGLYHSYIYQIVSKKYVNISYPKAVETLAFGVNNAGTVTGRWYDTAGLAHGFARTTHGVWYKYDYPGATFTTLERINDKGVATAVYTDTSGISHGLILTVK
jgi:hypothetical protein